MRISKEGYGSVDIRCPFWQGEMTKWRNEIRCEGIDKEDMTQTVSMNFTTMSKKDRFTGLRCAGRYEMCPVYQMVMKCKYED